MNTSLLLVLPKRVFFTHPKRSGTSECGNAVAPQAKNARKLNPHGDFSPKSWQGYTNEEFSLTDNDSPMPPNVFKVLAHLTSPPLPGTFAMSAPRASTTQDKLGTTAEITTSALSTMTRLTMNSVLQGPNSSSSERQYLKGSNNSSNNLHIEDLNSLLSRKRTHDQNLALLR